MTAKTDDLLPARDAANGLIISVRLTPKASANRITGIERDAGGAVFLTARVRAVPEKGKANTALAALIADWLDVPKSDCDLASGGKSRLKQVLIRGDAASLRAQLESRLADLESGKSS